MPDSKEAPCAKEQSSGGHWHSLEIVAEPTRLDAKEDAAQYACNAVDLDRHVFLNGASEKLQEKLRAAGFTPVIVPLSEFMRGGGGAKCLTLKLKESWGLVD